MDRYLGSTDIIDCDTEAIRQKARDLIKGLTTKEEMAKVLFSFVRDEIKFSLYAPTQKRRDHTASRTIERGNGICLHKAIVLIALARAAGIPARLELADIRNHRIPDQLRALLGGGNVLITNGFAQLFLCGKWVHVSPVYDLATCQKHGFVPVEFDGVNDARASACDQEGRAHVEYLRSYGHYKDFPWKEIYKAREEFAAALGIRDWTEHPL